MQFMDHYIWCIHFTFVDQLEYIHSHMYSNGLPVQKKLQDSSTKVKRLAVLYLIKLLHVQYELMF